MKDNFIIWKEKCGTGIRKIDEQHQHFVGLINRVYAFNENKREKIDLEEVFNDLTEYARVHFSTEEEYFDETGYPESDEHKEKHLELLSEVINFNKKFEAK